eukprot:Protomagalhaensia_wolfi_Nauph_80__4571@NODE_46_length_4258_cov_300_005452_g37_i0_p4_GENE_NODE_46_length_4258_cov_300_005452_g37_i0NODE_46_length_4258_cov_300_005452_g37_i0_p4_ORF_typecomplete_len125_score23_74_NODE_46_length_4258_cov_300_005452_g37_i029403314
MPETQVPDTDDKPHPLSRALSNSFENPGPFAREILKARSLSGFSRSAALEDLGPPQHSDSDSLGEIEEQDEATEAAIQAAEMAAEAAKIEASKVPARPVENDSPKQEDNENVNPSPKVSFAGGV